MSAHRYSWELHFGLIGKDLYVCHACDNPPCINPAHLFLGTQGDNIRDAVKKGRFTHARGGPRLLGSANYSARLTEAQVLAMRAEYRFRSVTLNHLAEKYGVSWATTQRVISRRTWTHI